MTATTTGTATDQDLLPFAEPAYMADPYPYYARVRDLTPVYESPSGVHVVTRHATCSGCCVTSGCSARQLDFGAGCAT